MTESNDRQFKKDRNGTLLTYRTWHYADSYIYNKARMRLHEKPNTAMVQKLLYQIIITQ